MKKLVLEDIIKQNACVLTVNHRLARHLSEQVNQYQQQQKKVAWITPQIAAYDHWLEQLWQQRFMCSEAVRFRDRVLLSDAQSHALWLDTINQSDFAQLLNVQSTAQQAQKARQLALQWGIKIEDAPSEDLHSFFSWNEAFKKKLTANNSIDKPLLSLFALDFIKDQPAHFKTPIVFAGFDVKTTAQKQLIAQFESCGCDVFEYHPDPIESNVARVESLSQEDESQAMARWAYELKQQRPDAQIGIVVPDLDARKNRLFQALSQQFYPSIDFACDLPADTVFDFSLGQPLLEQPLIKQALRLLKLSLGQRLTKHEAEQLLRSPFIAGGVSERSARDQLCREIFSSKHFKQDKFTLSLSLLRSFVGQRANLTGLQTAIERINTTHHKETALEWTLWIEQTLLAWGLTSARELSSAEYQTMDTWQDVLKTYQTFDGLFSTVNASKLLVQLQALCQQTVFQLQQTGASVRVMGVMESVGITFDALWVCGLSDVAWPTPVSLNPFLPAIEQRERGMIQASATLQTQVARQYIAMWKKAAPRVIFSHFISDATTSIAYKSTPLIDDVPVRDVERTAASSKAFNNIILEEVKDVFGSPLTITEQPIRGGVKLIEESLSCPFKAYAHHRLNAKKEDEKQFGVDAMEHGTLVHQALERFWQKTKTHDELKAISDDLYGVVSSLVDELMEEHQLNNSSLDDCFKDIEQKRLKTKLCQWLRFEKDQRQPFSVEAVEQEKVINLGPFSIKTKMDRIDVFEDGSKAIIDYKTGVVNKVNWAKTEPLKDPQVPLYATFSAENFSAMALASLKTGEQKIKGIRCDDKQPFTQLDCLDASDTWSALMTRLKNQITDGANQYAQGVAPVQPSGDACRYCDLTLLCRRHDIETGVYETE